MSWRCSIDPRPFLSKLLPRKLADVLWLAAQRVSYPPDFSPAEIALCSALVPYTMTSPERIVALANAVRYVSANKIPGAVVECGVWRGGSMMAVARTLLEIGAADRDLYLYDTFEGMSAPTADDVARSGQTADDALKNGVLCFASEGDVRANLESTRYPASLLHYVRGKVEDTIPKTLPSQIALLRLDTDWYESTRHELANLHPLVASGGVVIIDDYGAWSGARKAVDEFLAGLSPRPWMHRIDETGRAWVKT